MDENKTNTPYGRSNTPYMNPVYAQGYVADSLRNAQVLTTGGFKPLSKEERAEAARIAVEAGFSFDGYCTVLGGAEMGSEPGWENMGYTVDYLDESYGENALQLIYTYPDKYANDTDFREAECSPGWGTIPLARVDFTFVESSPTEQALSSALNDNYTPYMKVGWPTSVKFTDAESSRLALLATDIESFLKQMVTKYITGEESLDDIGLLEEGLKARGLDEYLEIYQTAYDRYINN